MSGTNHLVAGGGGNSIPHSSNAISQNEILESLPNDVAELQNALKILESDLSKSRSEVFKLKEENK